MRGIHWHKYAIIALALIGAASNGLQAWYAVIAGDHIEMIINLASASLLVIIFCLQLREIAKGQA